MSIQRSPAVPLDETPFLQPPLGRRYVRSFLFSRRIDAPLAQVHLLARVALILCLSAAQLRTFNTAHPDPLGALLLWLCGVCLFAGCGMHTRTARLYMLITLPTLLGIFVSWTIFNPVPGKFILLQQQVYSGTLALGFSLWQVLWLVIVVAYYWWRRELVVGVLLASAITLIATRFVALPGWAFVHLSFFHPLTISISERGIILALTKAAGYSGMLFATMALVVTCRDVELIGALSQLKVPQPVIFFLSTVFRALNLALTDYETIYQAQIARAVNARPRSFVKRVRDLGSIAVPMVAMMIRRSSEIGDALLARGYQLGRRNVDFYETSPWRGRDWLVLIFSLGLLYLAVGPHPVLTDLFLKW